MKLETEIRKLETQKLLKNDYPARPHDLCHPLHTPPRPSSVSSTHVPVPLPVRGLPQVPQDHP